MSIPQLQCRDRGLSALHARQSSCFALLHVMYDVTDGASHDNRGNNRPTGGYHKDGPVAHVFARPIVTVSAREQEHRDQAANCVSSKPFHDERPSFTGIRRLELRRGS
jgi:hypothetical protein